MTQSTDVVPAGTYDTGLEDLGGGLSVPRLRIRHRDGVFQDPDTNEEIPDIYAVILGLVKQRVLFDVNVADGDKPMCKSPNTEIGYPNLVAENARKRFPWAPSGYAQEQAPTDEAGRTFLACASCKLKDWGSHPTGQEKPWCSEQFTLPILYATSPERMAAFELTPALITFQKTGLSPTRKYLGAFQTRKLGAFTAFTKINLVVKKTGQVEYATPTFTRVGDTPREMWPDWIEDYNNIREFLIGQRPPAPVQEHAAAQETDPISGEVVGSQNATYVQPARSTPVASNVQRPGFGASSQQSAVPTSTPVVAPVDDDSDLPF